LDQKASDGEKAITTDAIIIVVSSLVFGIAFTLYDPIWPFLVEEAGIDLATYGYIASISQGFEFLVRWLSSAYLSPSTAYLISSLSISISTGVLLWSISPYTILTSLSTARMGRALHFLGRSQIVSMRFKKRGTAFGLTRVAGQVGMIIGPIIGYLILIIIYRELIFILGIFLGILSAIVAYPLLKNIPSRVKKSIMFWKGTLNPRIRNVTLLTILNNFARQAFFPFHFVAAPIIFGAGPEHIALASVIERIVSMSAGVPIGWLSDKLGERRSVMVISEIMVVSGMLFYIFPNLGITGFLISTLFIGLGMASYAPIAMALVSDLAPERPEDAVAFLLTGISLARIPASLVTGGLIALYGYTTAFSFSALCLVIVAIGLIMDYIHVKYEVF